MKLKLLIIIGIFLMIFSVDGFLLFDSSIPECKGFTCMGWFVFLHLGFEPMTVLSNSNCLTSFYVQTGILILFTIGLGLIILLVIKRHKDKIRCENRK